MKKLTRFLIGQVVILSSCSSRLIIPDRLSPDRVPQNNFDANGGDCTWACGRVLKQEDAVDYFSAQGENLVPHVKFNTAYKAFIWNIYKGRRSSFAPEFERLSENSQFVLVQEALNQDPVKSVLHKDPSREWWMLSTFKTKNGAKTGVSTGSIFKSVKQETFRTRDLEPFVGSPKSSLLTYYPLENTSGPTLLMINIHGINFQGDEALLNQILTIETAITQHTGPILFGGDFNTRNSDRRQIVQKICERNGLLQVPWTNQRAGKVLDLIYTRGLNLIKASYEYETLGSDHPAMLIEFSILKPQN